MTEARSLEPEANLNRKVQGRRSKDGTGAPTGNPLPIDSARVAALKMLARRELSEAQIRQRLQRRGHALDEIDSAIERLKSERAIDDARVAGAIARTETSLKRRGRLRVAQELARAGIARSTARTAIDETFDDLDDDALLQQALNRRLKNDRPIEDDREFQRLYRYLIGQGFESDRVVAALAKRRSARRARDPEPEPEA
jgi:regulatory protein